MIRLRPCLVHGLDGASRSKALSSQGPRAFFPFVRGDARLLPFTIFFWRHGRVFLAVFDGTAGTCRARVARAPSRRGLGREAANKSRCYTPAHLRSTESRTELAFAWGSADCSLWSVRGRQGTIMFNRNAIENELFSHSQSTTVASARRTLARGREDRGQRTEQWQLSRNAV